MGFIRSSLLVAGTIYLRIYVAATQSNETGRDCSKQPFRDGYNATGSITIPGFRVNDSYPVTAWTWSQYLVETAYDSNQSEIWQTLGLKTDPLLNLSDPKTPYTACAIAPIQVKYSAKAEKDDGTCSSVFDSDCLRAIQDSLREHASSLSGTLSGSSSVTPCGQIFDDLSAKGKKCEGMFGGWVSSQFMPNNFSEPMPTSPGCGYFNVGDSNSTRGFFSWSGSLGTSKGNFTAYDAAIRFPQPIFVAAWLKDTTNGSSYSYDTGSPPWSDTRVMCIPGNTTVAGSRNITEADAAANDVEKIRSNLFAVVGLAVFIGFVF